MSSRFLHFTRLFASDGQGSDGKINPGSADSIFGFFFYRILKAGEKRATDLLKEKEGELHRVSKLSSHAPFWLIF